MARTGVTSLKLFCRIHQENFGFRGRESNPGLPNKKLLTIYVTDILIDDKNETRIEAEFTAI